MHTYRTSSNRQGQLGFQVGTDGGASGSFTAVGPVCETEGEAAAFASYLNGGDYKPTTAGDLFKPAEEAREKQRKELEAQAKRDAEAEKARQQAANSAAQNDPSTSQADQSAAEQEADEDVENEKTQKAARRPHAHASHRKAEVKRGVKVNKARKHK